MIHFLFTLNSHFQLISRDKYCLVGPGYPLKYGYLVPYQKERYNLAQFETHEPLTYQELKYSVTDIHP